jgi:hypothetical protein
MAAKRWDPWRRGARPGSMVAGGRAALGC